MFHMCRHLAQPVQGFLARFAFSLNEPEFFQALQIKAKFSSEQVYKIFFSQAFIPWWQPFQTVYVHQTSFTPILYQTLSLTIICALNGQQTPSLGTLTSLHCWTTLPGQVTKKVKGHVNPHLRQHLRSLLATCRLSSSFSWLLSLMRKKPAGS